MSWNDNNKEAEEYFKAKDALIKKEEEAKSSSDCFMALKNEDDKYYCPKCLREEEGLVRKIHHKYTCEYFGSNYCQQEKKGGKRRTKRSRRRTRRTRRHRRK